MRVPNLLPMMAALYGLGLANIFIRSSMGVLAPELAADLALTPAMLGAIASAFFLSYAVMQIPTGLLLDRFGPRLVVIGLFLLTVIGTLLFALSPSGSVMLVARIMMGAGCAGVFAGAFLIIARFYPPARFTPIGATLNSFAMLGTFLATIPLAYLVTTLGWRDSFLWIGILMAMVALLAVLTLRDHPPGVDAQATRERQENLADVLAGSWAVMRTPGILSITSGGMALSAGNTILGIWGGPYLNDVHGLNETERGGVLIFMAMSGVAGHFLYGQAARIFNTLKGLVLAGTTAIAAILGTLALLPSPSLVTVTILLALLGLACGFPTILLAHGRALVPDHLIGRGLTTVNTGIMVAIAIMQMAVGALIGTVAVKATGQASPMGYRAAFGFIAVMAMVTFVIYSRVDDHKPR
ncbi:MAG: MFS transporter [Rhodospirillaceae bacterium]|nr:MFS transporter [Rhodospirillaceae bacterium]MBT4487432.1 MFS transporter [Rhodospirillaceae bacterium]MBT5194768.1 MFS transporter [Rhodospirillaceae bacterium]MBT5894732.1 MFS transporter [Rhodospirillaceae bacterium]MBT6426803.1 MFS transporter [Rhodospirillaceae bacterium]